MTLPPEVIKEDRDLESVAENATDALMYLRWHWTRDETNLGRVGTVEYARAVGKSENVISTHARGWEIKISLRDIAKDDLGERNPTDYVGLANMSQERADIVDAVARAEGVGVYHAQKTRKDDISRVRDAVESHMELHPAASREERQEVARRTAKNISTSRKMEREQRDRLLRSQPHLLTEILGETAKARESLIKARALAKDADPSLLPSDGLDRIDNALQEVSRLASDTRSLLGRTAWDTAGL